MLGAEMTKVVIGFSGGVDSSVSAHILQEQGYQVTGVYFDHFHHLEQRNRAFQVAQYLGIDFQVIDLKKDFQKIVIDRFLSAYSSGKTPNPCVFCNQLFKFGIFLEYLEHHFSADYMATGHYAKQQKMNHTYKLCVPKDKTNDQTYFLHQLNQNQLSRIIWPLSDMTKDEVRQRAQFLGLPNFDTKSSTDICFLQGQKTHNFLKQYLPQTPGNIREISSQQVLGKHIGLSFYTLGQRKNLHIGGVKGFAEKPWFVVRKDFETNTLYVSQDEKFLLSQTLMAKNINWVAGKPPAQNFQAKAIIRYRSQRHDSTVILHYDQEASVQFKNSVSGITPGQYVVFYDGEECLGGGEIEST